MNNELSSRLDRALSVALVIAAVMMAIAMTKREFFPGGPAPRAMVFEPRWRDALPGARPIGDIGDRIQIVSFSDFECPFCARFHTTVREIQRRFPGKVGYAFVHFPIPAHRNALAAAHAAECAAELGYFTDAADSLFAAQQQLGTVQWLNIVHPRTPLDSTRARNCLLRPSGADRLVQEGKDLGAKFQVTGTPAVFLNGWRYPGMPSDTELTRAVQDILAGRIPYKGFPKSALNLAPVAITTSK